MQGVLIFLLSITAAIVYGIAHDQITVRICVEYFTIGHPPVFPTSDPTMLALGWGIIATWWVGAILGVPLALAARVGKQPPLPASALVKPIFLLLACMATCAALAGLAGYVAASNHIVVLSGDLAERIPPDRHIPFLVDLWTHLASYASGFLGGLLLIAWTLIARYKADVAQRLTDQRATRGN
jgi:hypothetical protein